MERINRLIVVSLASVSTAGAALGQTVAASDAGLPDQAGASPRADARIGEFNALHPLHRPDEPDFGTRNLGDTFDSETLVADSPLINEFAWVSFFPLGQSILADGFFNFAGTSQLNGFDIDAGVGEFDNGDGTITIVVDTRIEPFSDGFLPAGFIFTPSGTPIDTLGWLFGAGADRDGNPDAYDPQLAAAFPPAGEFTVVGADIFLLDNGITIGSGTFSGLPYLNQTDMGFFITVAGAAGSNIDEMIVQYLVQSANAPTQLTLGAVDGCLDATENQLVVEIDAAGLAALNVGGQFFLDYDNTLLDFVSADPGDAPYSVEIFESVDEAAGTIDYAVGVPNGDAGTAVPTTMARITFNVLGDFCDTAGLVTFRPHTPPSRISDGLGNDLGAALIDLGEITKDSVPPTVTPPVDITMNADAGGCDAVVVVPPLSASDDCSAVTIVNDFTGTDDASGVYPQGTTTVTWTVTDACGNATVVTQDITINASNTLDAVVELAAVDPGPFDRCVEFELLPTGGGTPVVVETTMTFTGGVASASLDIPCGDYGCITARDPLHTLRATDNDNFTITGTTYTADFSASPGDNDALVGGNLNGDMFIDILDFGVFISRFGSSPGADSPCGTPAPHADISGDGLVNAADFTFIQSNFLAMNEARCDGSFLRTGPLGVAHAPRPVLRIAVADLKRMGLADLAAGDLNRDGVLDRDDIVAFFAGSRPDHLADLDHDGAVTAADLMRVVLTMNDGDPAADVNRDGRVDLADLRFVADRIGMHIPGSD